MNKRSLLSLNSSSNTNTTKRQILSTNVENLDPTRTTTLRGKFVSEINGRFAKVRKSVREYVEGINDDYLTETFDFATDSDKIASFNRWLQGQIDSDILGTTGDQWTDQYVFSAYKSGLTQSNTNLKAGGVEVPDVPEALNLPVHQNSIELLYTRVYTGLEGITKDMSTQMSRILAQGFADGKNPNTIAAEMTKKIDNITRVRARALARTEVINAHANATLNNFEAAGVEEVEVIPEWLTAGDDKVCAVCQALSTKTYTIEEARGLIPAHPNCRCAWRPKVIRDDE